MAWSIAEHDKMLRHIAIAQHAMIAQGNLLPRLPEVTAPALVMAGVNSSIARKARMLKMRDALPNAKLVLFDVYTQGIAFSAPQRCVSEMRVFLAELRLRSQRSDIQKTV